jgi:hypothetical protein
MGPNDRDGETLDSSISSTHDVSSIAPPYSCADAEDLGAYGGARFAADAHTLRVAVLQPYALPNPSHLETDRCACFAADAYSLRVPVPGPDRQSNAGNVEADGCTRIAADTHTVCVAVPRSHTRTNPGYLGSNHGTNHAGGAAISAPVIFPNADLSTYMGPHAVLRRR